MNLVAQTFASDCLPDETAARLRAIWEREFGWDRLAYATPQWYVVGTLRGALIGRVGITKRVILVSGSPLEVGGVTGVVTESDYRRRGVARQLVGKALEFLRDEQKVSLALLTCNRKVGPLYEKLGWRVIPGPTLYAQPNGDRICPGLTMVAESGSESCPEGPIDMRGLPW